VERNRKQETDTNLKRRDQLEEPVQLHSNKMDSRKIGATFKYNLNLVRIFRLSRRCCYNSRFSGFHRSMLPPSLG
jgi:type II secretory pathway component PulK